MPTNLLREVTNNMVNFDATKEDAKLIRDVARRVFDMNPDTDYNYLDLVMDLEAVHSPLDFPDFDFEHDIYGIQRHIDRTTGKLTDFFVPRCAKPEDSSS
jgi:hypothetical protein